MLHPVLLFLNIGTSEMILIMFVALLLFGGEKLPQIARGLGKGIRDFKDASEGVKRELHNQINNFEEKNTPAVAPEPDKDLPVVANTAPLLDPFAAPAVHGDTHPDEVHQLEEHHEGALATINQHNDAVPVSESYADLSHLVTPAHTEVTHVAENHINLSHVSEEPKAEEKKS
ncbi:Sec-independent protein translocase subunit TatA/TatB [Mucilaginibacter polytrichastri]|uniref:Sec-independent protein translocase protein TatA n=1 Tax=Mucilaginibacter polytrichastri TaxID=1302689 RepID=A0A1Q6A689_9SPHI|nr:twin-arginine translocase TatA/TatE family subunit [Mucilaginibacter polytrichastri]OKS89525.1 Sec-independent protein translocase protein TatA [Mucilaginibacter polytrichastri]SFS70878.1 twin arginine-targeting protein translocase, TatA/E family [Mucilaginibacter polytrichastri]